MEHLWELVASLPTHFPIKLHSFPTLYLTPLASQCSSKAQKRGSARAATAPRGNNSNTSSTFPFVYDSFPTHSYVPLT